VTVTRRDYTAAGLALPERPIARRPLVSIVIGTLDRRWYLQRTIESVREELPLGEREIIVVDGGSDDGTVQWLAQQKDVITVLQHNRGTWAGEPLRRRSWGYFMNLGFKIAAAPFICMLSDDCLLLPGSMKSGIEAFDRKDVQVGAVAFYWRNWPEETTYRVGATFGNRLFVNHGLFSRDALAAVEFADEETFGFYHADGDLCLRLAEAGWTCVDSPESFVEHHSHANLPLRSANLEGQAADWAAYTSRWGHLGPPEPAWIERDHSDAHQTISRFWQNHERRRPWTWALDHVPSLFRIR
jgi:GT2 family glycosyltransferase